MKRCAMPVIACGLAITFLATGTLAWNSFSQHAKNMFRGFEYGAQLHDYFGVPKDTALENVANWQDKEFTKELDNQNIDNGVEKHVYVENNGESTKDIYVRVRLDVTTDTRTAEHADWNVTDQFTNFVSSFTPTWKVDTAYFDETNNVPLQSTNGGNNGGKIDSKGNHEYVLDETTHTTPWIWVGDKVKEIGDFDTNGTGAEEWYYDKDDGWYYWGKPLKRDEKTAELLSKVYGVLASVGKDYEYAIDVSLQAVSWDDVIEFNGYVLEGNKINENKGITAHTKISTDAAKGLLNTIRPSGETEISDWDQRY